MADSGSTPPRDPGGLHIYNMNGSGNKMAELTSDSQGPMGMYADMSPGPFQMGMQYSSNNYVTNHRNSFRSDGGQTYEDVKIPLSQMQSSFTFQNVESLPQLNSMSNLFHGSGHYSAAQDSNSALSGYVDMLSNPESFVVIKQEKMDYNEFGGTANCANSSGTPYPLNTSVPDWNFYNPEPGHNQMAGHQTGFEFPGHNEHHFQGNMMFQNTQHSHSFEQPFQTNADIHQKAMKISQTILSSEWGHPDTSSLYKPTMYSHLASNQPVNRKRKTDGNKTKNAKARKVKSNSGDIGRHSKAVASILMSSNSNKSTGCSQSPDGILDSSDRNSLVTSLMDNIRSTVQFESFCLSFPRSDAKENAFRHKVVATADVVHNVYTNAILSQPLPSSMLMHASKVISNFKNALENTRSNGVISDTNITDCIESKSFRHDQIEEHLPHSMVWVVKLGCHMLAARWEGQFIVGVNPVQKILSFSIFQFEPNFSPEATKCLHHAKLTKDLANDIIQNMEQFEVSRQLRCDVNLTKVKQLYLYRPSAVSDIGCLVLETTEKPTFFQKWLHTSAEDKNKWHKRKDFFSKYKTVGNDLICIGGLMSELNELAALLLASDHDMEALYESGLHQTFRFDYNTQWTVIPSANESQNGDVVSKRIGVRKNTRNLGSNVQKLRKEIVAVLVNHNIAAVEHSDYDTHSKDVIGDKDCLNNEISLGIRVDDGVCPCLQDFVNFSCDSAIELNATLEKELQPRAFGFYEKDFDMSRVPGADIDRLKIGELISNRCSEVVFYSFCNREIGQIGYDKHCRRCRQCRTMQFWHCDTCDICTNTRSVCEFCGHLRHDQNQCIIKPLSVFRSQVMTNGVVSTDDIKKQWLDSLSRPDDDVLIFDLPYLDDNSVETVEYNSQNAMVDQLGLLNPVGFLLGQANAECRKHRRCKGGQLLDIVPSSRKGGQLNESGCTVQ